MGEQTMSIHKNKYHARNLVEFDKEYSFTEKSDGSVVMKHNGAVLDLVVGKCYAYTERQSTGATKSYHAFLTNIEFKDKKFFSITVDVYNNSSTESLHKSNVYVYNPIRLPERATRFRIKQNTVSKTIEFWKTLTLDESFPKKQHSDIEFFRNAHHYLKPNKTGKSCSIREKNKTLKDRFRKLDRLKKHNKRPLLREEHGLVTVYSFPTNKLHVKEFEFRKGDILEQEVADKVWKTLTVLDVLADRVTLQADGREHDVFYDDDWSTIRKPETTPRSETGDSIRLKSMPTMLQVNDEVECDDNVKGTVYEITNTKNGNLIRVRAPTIEYRNAQNCKKIVAPTPTIELKKGGSIRFEEVNGGGRRNRRTRRRRLHTSSLR